ncbi:MAG: DNA repair protein RecN [Acidimicrobiales bacterium]
MLIELRVRNLGVIEDLVLQLKGGMTVLTGETGAGKTLLVEAVELLMGGRADPGLVRSGAEAALVEGRFVDGTEEVILSREVPREGRSRAYIDGRMATASALAELGAGLVDIHGQHSHQSLLHQSAQRSALDCYAGVDTAGVLAAQDRVRQIEKRLAELGGDEHALARELDLLRFQLSELDAADLCDPAEDEKLQAEEVLLSDLEGLRMAAEEGRTTLGEDEGARDLLGRASVVLAGRSLLADLADRLTALAVEVDDITRELRARLDSFDDDPRRLLELQERRRLLGDLRRKYGPDLVSVMQYRDEARARLDDLEAGDIRRAELIAERAEALDQLVIAEQVLGDARRRAAPRLAGEIQAGLRTLALPRARLVIDVPSEGRADAVEFRFSADAGEAALALAKVASGGELSRAMLATRLILTGAPATLVFDEVDAGVGGEAALSVGRALGELGERHQVLVVTHLAQVAAFASCQIAIGKQERSGRTITSARPVCGEERLAELSRMLSGQPSSQTARRHAEELLQVASGR